MEAQQVRVIGKRDLGHWVKRLLERSDVIAPISVEGADVFYAPISRPTEVLWDFENSILPPRQHLIPQLDTIAHIHRRDDLYQIEAPRPPRPRVMLNVRSCDAVGLQYLRQMYERDLCDDAMVRRADSMTIVTLACHKPCTDGFCICANAGPFLESGYDVQLTDLGEELLVEAGTAKGAALLDEDAQLFRPASPQALEKRLQLEHDVLALFGENTCHFGSAMRRLSTRRVPDELWEELSHWCLECGSCTFVCPTCYCYSVADRSVGDHAWQRCRIWDSCQYSAFTLEASGHNPRADRRERVKRRFYHKVSAQYCQRDGRVGCVGCGRCVRVCLGRTDMPAVVRAIRKGRLEQEAPA